MRKPIILWDVMGTLVTEPFKEAMPKFLGMSFEAMLEIKDPDSWIEFEHGRIDEREYGRRFFADGRPIDLEGLKRAMRAAYALLPGMEDILREHKGRPMYALSNYSNWYHLIEEATGLSRYIRWDFVSCETGLRKPDPEAYLHPTRALGVEPNACVFIDDRQVNVDAARAVGMQAILRTPDPEQLRKDLSALGLEPLS